MHGEGRAETAMQDMTTRGVEGLMVSNPAIWSASAANTHCYLAGQYTTHHRSVGPDIFPDGTTFILSKMGNQWTRLQSKKAT